MVDHTSIQTYAEALQRQEIFLRLVLYYVASRLQHKILNAGEVTATLLSDGLIIDEYQIRYLQTHLEEFLTQSAFWEFCAEQILTRFEDWKRTGERPANIGSGGLATVIRKPTLSKDAEKEDAEKEDAEKEDAEKKAEVQDRFAADAADWLIEQLQVEQLEVEQLEELLGFKMERERLKTGTAKLSQLQKKILLKLLETTKGHRHRSVPWTPAAWFGTQSKSDRAATSRALKKLEERQLVVRRSSHQEGAPKRTALLELTDLGLWSVKLLTPTKE